MNIKGKRLICLLAFKCSLVNQSKEIDMIKTGKLNKRKYGFNEQNVESMIKRAIIFIKIFFTI